MSELMSLKYLPQRTQITASSVGYLIHLAAAAAAAKSLHLRGQIAPSLQKTVSLRKERSKVIRGSHQESH